MLLLNLMQYLENITVLSECLRLITPQLQGPTLFYHDNTGSRDVIAKSLAESRPIIQASYPERPVVGYGIRSAILLATSPQPITETLRYWSVWKGRSHVVVITESRSKVREWIEYLWKKTRAVNVVVAVLGDPTEYFTWFPYRENECNNVTTIVKLNRTNLFPQKIIPPLKGCPLRAVTTRLAPFVVNETHGIESRVFQALARKLGMEAQYAHLSNGQLVWNVFGADYRPISGLKLVFDNEVDLLFSQMSMSFLTAPFSEFLYPHTNEKYLFFVPGPREAPRTSAIIRAFAPKAWLLVCLATSLIFATILTILFIEKGKLEPSTSLLHTIAIALNTASHLPPSKTVLLFAMAAYIYSMHITTAYTSSFIVFLSDVPREKPMQTLQDIVDSGIKVHFLAPFRTTIDTLSTSPLINALNQPNRAIYSNLLSLAPVAEGQNVFLGPKISFKNQLEQDVYYDEFDYPKVLLIDIPVYYIFVSFYISKGHPLYHELNRNLRRLIEGGLLEFYADEVAVPQRPRLRNLEAFGIQNVEGPFMLLLGLLSVCFFVWICEWVWYWTRKTKRKNQPNPIRNQMRFLSFLHHMNPIEQ